MFFFIGAGYSINPTENECFPWIMPNLTTTLQPCNPETSRTIINQTSVS